MSQILKFQLKYFLLALLLLFSEICIALFIHDNFIRPYIGDALVVVLIYCFVKSFLNLPVIPTALSILLFSFIVETLQFFKIVKMIGLQNSKLAKIIIGTSFSWEDIIAYCAGIILVISLEKYVATPKKTISTE
ncbi:DUF2809 domain-containing protein [Leptospira yasudae]|uniref:ribosomal maturation YjgA family protein n=1 Tax=Leptospira yasudae TaxID=2202201 RepID=UPI001C4FC058|nr:DUF2809 domain-containing protein [Leptospira yasudae]